MHSHMDVYNYIYRAVSKGKTEESAKKYLSKNSNIKSRYEQNCNENILAVVKFPKYVTECQGTRY